ncbi:hypothetical protein PAHAL_2G247200 [Panicum hallii]|jgi:hypothetical protein|uniref:Uncharacterized protein n=1 Tax=Panicum hallii TaxID=206008 RepID=A0A2T8KQB9_9POAL|nr:hypothetical protein PAHAL_2G247200 [Panicum hallii]
MWLFFQVKISGSEYTCGSINNCGGTMSTNKWVADRAVDLLRDNHEMGPRELLDMYSYFCWTCLWEYDLDMMVPLFGHDGM